MRRRPDVTLTQLRYFVKAATYSSMPSFTSRMKALPSPRIKSCRTPSACAFMPSMAPVSRAVSPCATCVDEPSTITGWAPSRAAAPAQLDFVRVELSKKSA